MIKNNDVPAESRNITGVESLVGHRFIYTFSNGWQYEMYVKNATTIDYRIHSGIVGGRWVKGQSVDLVALADGVFKLSWHEPTGTSAVVNLMPGLRRVHGTIFFPRWVVDNPQRTALFQNEHLDEMHALRDAGPMLPIEVITVFADLTFIEFVGGNDENAIAVGPKDLPEGFADRVA